MQTLSLSYYTPEDGPLAAGGSRDHARRASMPAATRRLSTAEDGVSVGVGVGAGASEPGLGPRRPPATSASPV